MSLPQYAMVQLLTDRYKDRGLSAGSRGVILEVYDDADYEVEFVREDCTTIDWFAVPQSEVGAVGDTHASRRHATPASKS